MSSTPGPLTLETLVEIVGKTAFDAACHEARSSAEGSMESDVPHKASDRVWYSGPESFFERLSVAVDLYRRMPCYANLMYWRYRDFDEEARAQMWAAHRQFAGDPDERVARPIEYSLWVDYFEDATTVERAWSEVSGPEEPRRPRLARVVAASVQCICGSIERASALSIFQRLRDPANDHIRCQSAPLRRRSPAQAVPTAS